MLNSKKHLLVLQVSTKDISESITHSTKFLNISLGPEKLCMAVMYLLGNRGN